MMQSQRRIAVLQKSGVFFLFQTVLCFIYSSYMYMALSIGRKYLCYTDHVYIKIVKQPIRFEFLSFLAHLSESSSELF